MLKTNLKTQLESFEKGIIIDSEGKKSRCFNFYDWFCNDSSLEKKAKTLFPKVKKFLKNYPEIDVEKTYVFFKNNCPMNGSTYDDFRICDIESGDVIYTVTPKTGHRNVPTNERAEIWSNKNNFNGPLKKASTFTELIKRD